MLEKNSKIKIIDDMPDIQKIDNMKYTFFLLAALLAHTIEAQHLSGLPASDTLGADDLGYNPTFIGGVANGGGTAHGVW